MGSTELAQAKALIDAADLQPVLDRLVSIEGWSPSEATAVIKQYRNYLFLRKKYPQENLPPSKDIDEAWHAHVLHTEDYRNFCRQVFSNEADQYLDHHPHIAKEGSVESLNKLFERTQALYREEFGEYIYQIAGRSFIRKCLDKIRGILVTRYPKLLNTLEE